MKKVCVASKHLTSLESNVVYVGHLNNDQYQCPEGLCAELGSLARPAKTIFEAFSVIEKRYSIETPVTISLSPGEYSSGTVSKSLTFPKNVVGFVSLLGTATLESDVNLHNIKKMDMQNIHLKGDFNILADGNHLGEVTWNGGILEGKYTYKVTDNAAHTFRMKEFKQVYEPVIQLGEVRFNSISVGDSGEAFIQKTACSVSSPFKSKIHISENGKLSRQIEKCSIFAGGETSEFAGFAEFNDTYQDNKLETHKNAKDSDIFEEFVKDSSKITKTWTTTNLNAKVAKGKTLFKKQIMGKSNYHTKSFDSIFNIQGEGMFRKMNIKDEAKHFLDSTRTTLNIPEGEGHYSMIKAEDSSFLYKLLHQRNINAPFRTGRIELNDKVRTTVTCFNSRRVSAGYETYLRGDSSYTETSNGNISISGPKGFHGRAEMVDNAQHHRSETNGIKILSNKLDESIHDIVLKDNAKSTLSCLGGQRRYRIFKSAPFKQAICKDIVQMNNSKCRYSANNMRREVEGGSMVKHLLNDSSELDVTEQNGDCRAKLLLQVNRLHSLTANDQSKARIQGSNNSKQIIGGTISEIVQNHSSNVDIVSRGACVNHDSPDMSYVVKTNDEAQHIYKGTGGDISSAARQQEITTSGTSKYSGTYSNNVLKSPLLVYRFAEEGSQHVCQSDAQELIGDSFYEGDVVSRIVNTSHLGKRNNKEGSHTWNSSILEGPLQTVGGKFTSNVSTFKNIFQNIDSENTSLRLNNTSFETLNSANIKSTAKGKLIDLKAKVCSFENTDDNVGHIDLSHDSHEDSLHEVATGICSTTSKTLIAADNNRKVKAIFTDSLNNSQKDPVRAEASELVRNSNSVTQALI